MNSPDDFPGQNYLDLVILHVWCFGEQENAEKTKSSETLLLERKHFPDEHTLNIAPCAASLTQRNSIAGDHNALYSSIRESR
jgi:hypothetical protein